MTVPLTDSVRPTPRSLQLPEGRRLALQRDAPLVMGILNLTPDSFSDGGLWADCSTAVDRALELFEQGAAIVDLGAESTRPGGGVYGSGAIDIPAEEELSRLLPVLEKLRGRTDGVISVDTRKAAVAAAALAEGADLINDVSALAEPALGAAVAASGCPVILMHSRGQIRSMQHGIEFDDVVGEVRSELEDAVRRAVGMGISRPQILVDPGIGFGKTTTQNLDLLRRLSAFTDLGPVLVGASRKSFIGEVAGAPVEGRVPGSLAAAAWAALGGAAIVRVHDVAETVQFLAVWREIEARGEAR